MNFYFDQLLIILFQLIFLGTEIGNEQITQEAVLMTIGEGEAEVVVVVETGIEIETVIVSVMIGGGALARVPKMDFAVQVLQLTRQSF